jgi:tRNA U34 5-carboxymethylaminomethyl modifying GTPase MnmE/TrmE
LAQAVGPLEVVAGEVSAASHHLGELTGDDATADVIDAIFRRFCIGK